MSEHDYSKDSLFSSTIIEWNNLDFNIRTRLKIFKKRILAFLRLSAKCALHCHNHNGLKLIARLRLGLSDFA